MFDIGRVLLACNINIKIAYATYIITGGGYVNEGLSNETLLQNKDMRAISVYYLPRLKENGSFPNCTLHSRRNCTSRSQE